MKKTYILLSTILFILQQSVYCELSNHCLEKQIEEKLITINTKCKDAPKQGPPGPRGPQGLQGPVGASANSVFAHANNVSDDFIQGGGSINDNSIISLTLQEYSANFSQIAFSNGRYGINLQTSGRYQIQYTLGFTGNSSSVVCALYQQTSTDSTATQIPNSIYSSINLTTSTIFGQVTTNLNSGTIITLRNARLIPGANEDFYLGKEGNQYEGSPIQTSASITITKLND